MEKEELYNKLNYLYTKNVQITIQDKQPDQSELRDWIDKYKEVEKQCLEIQKEWPLSMLNLLESVYIKNLRYQQLFRLFIKSSKSSFYFEQLFSIVYSQVYFKLIRSNEACKNRLPLQVGRNLLHSINEIEIEYQPQSGYSLGIWNTLLVYSTFILGLDEETATQIITPIRDDQFQNDYHNLVNSEFDGKYKHIIFWNYFNTGCGLHLRGHIDLANKHFKYFQKLNGHHFQAVDIDLVDNVKSYQVGRGILNVYNISQSFLDDYRDYKEKHKKLAERTAYNNYVLQLKKNQFQNSVRRLDQRLLENRQSQLEQSAFTMVDKDELCMDKKIGFYRLQLISASLNHTIKKDDIFTEFFKSSIQNKKVYNESWVGQNIFMLADQARDLWIFYFNFIENDSKVLYIEQILQQAEVCFQKDDTCLKNLLAVARYLRHLQSYQLAYAIICYLRKKIVGICRESFTAYMPYVYYQKAKIGIIINFSQGAFSDYQKSLEMAINYKRNQLSFWLPDSEDRRRHQWNFIMTLVIQQCILAFFLNKKQEFHEAYQQGKAYLDKLRGSNIFPDAIHSLITEQLERQSLNWFEYKSGQIILQQILPHLFKSSNNSVKVSNKIIEISTSLELKQLVLTQDLEFKHKPTQIFWNILTKRKPKQKSNNGQILEASPQERESRKTNTLFTLCFCLLTCTSIPELTLEKQQENIQHIAHILREFMNKYFSYTMLKKLQFNNIKDLYLRSLLLVELCQDGADLILNDLQQQIALESRDKPTTELSNLQAKLHSLKGDIAFYKEDFEQAKSSYLKALNYRNINASNSFRLGIIHKIQNKYVESFKFFQQSFQDPVYRLPSFYYFQNIVYHSKSMVIDGQKNFREISGWRSKNFQLEDFHRLQALCEWKNIETRGALHESCILPSSTRQSSFKNDIYLDESELILLKHSQSVVLQSQLYQRSETRTDSALFVKSELVQDDDVDQNIQSALYLNRSDLRQLITVITSDFKNDEKIVERLSELEEMINDETMLRVEGDYFLQHQKEIKHIASTLNSRVSQIKFLDQIFALKQIKIVYTHDISRITHQEYKDVVNFLDEVRILYRLKKLGIKNICSLIYFGYQCVLQLGKKVYDFYLLTPFYQSLSQQDIYNLPDRSKVQVLFSLMDTMMELHKNNIIHSDLKIQNVLIDRQLNPILIDFGISKIGKESIKNLAEISFYDSTTSATLNYCAPEQLKGETIKQSDIYSFCCLTFELFAQQSPWCSINDIQLLSYIFQTSFAEHHIQQIQNIQHEQIRKIIQGGTKFQGTDRLSWDEIRELLIELDKNFEDLSFSHGQNNTFFQESSILLRKSDLNKIATQIDEKSNEQTSLIKVLEQDFEYHEELMDRLSDIKIIEADERLLKYEPQYFKQNSREIKQIFSTPFSKVSQIMFFEEVYALKTISLTYKTEKTEACLFNLLKILDEVIILHKLKKLQIKNVNEIMYFTYQIKEQQESKQIDFFIVTAFYQQLPAKYIYGLKLKQKCQILYKVLQIIQDLHKNNIIHSDINFSNILINQQLEPVLVDFGQAKLIQKLTNYGNFQGNVRYRAPEQFKDETDKLSDIYSFCCLVYEFYVGKSPWIDVEEADLINVLQEESFTEHHKQQIEDIPFKIIKDIIRSGTQQDRSQRCDLENLKTKLQIFESAYGDGDDFV